ncbi:RNA polymerase sigma factor [Rubrolithibacter danxiaensis]|uniref:RNA polymerase sigma factor n=1 Tax=Rubrolithibacter danxiaensis TaxID=3390805 RepID=UPI003BF7B2E0
MKFLKFRNTDQVDEPLMLAEYRRTHELEILGKLYEKYMPLVYGVCLKYLKDEEQSKDGVMQIFEQLIDKLKIHEVGNFKSWLYTLARNYCLMALRTASKHETVNLQDNFVEKGADFHLNSEASKEGELDLMEKCMEKLPEEQRISIDLFYLQQKCYKDVADLTGFDINKVKSYIQNGKRNLKICMEKNRGNEQY